MPKTDEVKVSAALSERLRKSRSVFVLTGAGVSAESGVPTFRGGGGATTWKGMPFEVISSAEMVRRDLPAVWEWFDYRLNLLANCSPNPAHETLARWQERFEEFTLVTQNIDGLHKAAGSREVLELHGNIREARCQSCGLMKETAQLGDRRPPRCPACDAPMRPNVVLFGEMLPAGVYEEAAHRAARAELCFVIGTSAVVYPAAGLPVIARRAGAYVVEINPEPSALSDICDEVLEGRAGRLLPLLDEG